MRKTKIICTLGPASESEEMIEKLCYAGMNVARLNFSHGAYPDHQVKIDRVKKVREKIKMPIALMLDTKGPEYRIKTFKDHKITLKDGDEFTFTTDDVEGDEKRVSVNYKNLVKELKAGDKILVNNGLVILTVKKIEGNNAVCEVITGGVLSDRKSMNFPAKVLDHPYLSEVDKADLLFGIKNDVDFVAASFVSKKEDVVALRNFLNENGGQNIDIIAKIENRSGVDNIDGICEVCDGIMVARGDLGVEIPFEEVPPIQKFLITKCRQLGKRVITATEMLESMITNPRPTRAEISDVANAVYDGSSAIMLSGESAAGKYPEETVKVMANIAMNTEKNIDYIEIAKKSKFQLKNSIDALSHATCSLANDLGAKCIVVTTKTGTTARMVSRFRSPIPILGVTTKEKVFRKLALSWGVTPLLTNTNYKDSDEIYHEGFKEAIMTYKLQMGDTVVMTGGEISGRGNTNTIKLFTVGKSN